MLYNKLRVINVLYTVYNQNSPYVVSDSQFADAIFTGQYGIVGFNVPLDTI